jgi:ABC-2 type transport system ATP-binding protein/lipopolysaccharide transport system ATP-binding protein
MVRVENLSVKLELHRERVTSLREYIVRIAKGRRVPRDEFWPLRDVSFHIDKGEVFGIIGQNGAGKSTLLRVIAGIIKPTQGNVEVNGRVAPLIELGAGFDPEMTGRENVFLYGALLGFSNRRMAHKMDEIMRFAELDEFADVPLKNYSSGMVARLGFAIATDVETDLLLVDEVLSVGDESFKRKCADRINRFRDNGVSIVFVSHSLAQVEAICSRAAWIDHGRLRSVGSAKQVTAEYDNATK